MRAMKDSGIQWIGDLPETWTVPKLLYVLREKICDGPHETPNYIEEGIPFISIDNLNESKQISFDRVKRFISEDDYNLYCQKTKIEVGDVLFSKAATIGKTAIVGHERFMVWSPLAILKNDARKIRNDYLYYLMNCTNLINTIALSGSANTQINVGMREMEQTRIPLPPIDEQRRIADFLDAECSRIDAVIEQTRASIEEYKKLKQAVITQAVTKGIRPDRPMKDSGIEWIGEIASDYKLAKIKVGVTKVGSGKTPPGGAESYAEEGILFLRSQNVYDTGLVLDNTTYITDEMDEEMKNTRVQPEDVLLNITGGSIGRCCIFPTEFKRANVNQHVSIIRVIKSVFLPEYMHYYWLSKLGYMSIHLYQTGGNREGMTADAIKNSPIPLIPIKEQKEIVGYLDSKCLEIDSLIDKKECFLAELDTYKKSLIFEYVTGKKDVYDNNGSE